MLLSRRSPMEKLNLIFLLFSIGFVSGAFREGDIVSSARRGQFSGSRTSWHDLLARHCARFATATKVAIPIPQPKGYIAVQKTYKIQFTFDGGRIISPWIQIIGKNARAAPIIHLEFTHQGDIITSVNAEVVPVTPDYLMEHEVLLREFVNATLWPKHLLVHYSWKQISPIHTNAGLYLVFLLGIIITAILGISALVAYEGKLQAFLSDIAAEESNTLYDTDSRFHVNTPAKAD